MVDTKLVDLTGIASADVTRVGSMFFYAVAGGDRKVGGDTLQGIIGPNVGVLLSPSADVSVPTTTGYIPVSWSAAEYDLGGYWSSASSSIIRFPNDKIAYARFGFGCRLTVAVNTLAQFSLYKNQAGFHGVPVMTKLNATTKEGTIWSAPVAINSGDRFEATVFVSATNSINGTTRTWFCMIPEAWR